MGNTKKPRKKYRPGRVLRDPVGYVLEGMTAVRLHGEYLVDLRIANSAAMAALLQGKARKPDIDKLIAMCNITETLLVMGFGSEYADALEQGSEALAAIVNRSLKHGKFTPTGPEIISLNILMELHDAQMDVITLNDMEKAIDLAKRRIDRRIGTVLPEVPEHLK